MKEEKLKEINKELKVYINESTFISMKCRNKLLKFFAEEFQVDLDIDNYKNVDLSIQDDFKILYRDDLYEMEEKNLSIEQIEEKYHNFQKKADELIHHNDIDFERRKNFSNLANFLIVICLFLAMIGFLVLGVFAFFSGNYFDCLWLLIFVLPWVIPNLKTNLENRITQAKNYVKGRKKRK